MNGNKGIAEAQNRGVSFLKNKGVDFVFFADQDSVFSEDYFEKMVNRWNYIERNDNTIGALAPIIYEEKSREFDSVQVFNLNRGLQLFSVNNFSNICEDIKNTIPISSGLLTKVNIFTELGGNHSELFIDMVDMQFDFDLIIKGYSLYTTSKVRLNHSIGNITTKQFLWKKFTVTNHPVWREYYFFRNCFYLMLINRSVSLQIVKFYKKAIIFRLKRIFFEEHYLKRLVCFLRGMKDGIIIFKLNTSTNKKNKK